MFFLSDIEPIKTAEAFCRRFPEDEVHLQSLELNHGSLIELLSKVASHQHASVIPAFLSMDRFFIGHKKDVIHIDYSFGSKQLKATYYKNQDHNDVLRESVGECSKLIEEVIEMIDFYVSRHKRLNNPPQT